MASMNESPRSERVHIGFFGKSNSGKSSLINSVSGQNVSIVSEIMGTTTDPVYKNMEINPIGPCVLIDTAGLGDETDLSKLRDEKTKLVIDKTDIAIIVIDATQILTKDSEELSLYELFIAKNIPVIFAVNKIDLSVSDLSDLVQCIIKFTGIDEEKIVALSAKNSVGLDKLKDCLLKHYEDGKLEHSITGNLVSKGDVVLLVMPQDIQAPKGRLILPQVQTIRELLDKKCLVLCATTDDFLSMLDKLKSPPKLIITDSQVFDYVYKNKPTESYLTSFSVLFAGYKGDIEYYIKSVKAIDKLNGESRILIAECCSHAPMEEDIGRVKIPAMLKKRFGDGVSIDVVSGTDFMDDLSDYDIIIQCGGCMFNRSHIMSRINRAKEQNIPMTNYGIFIAYVKGILDKVVTA